MAVLQSGGHGLTQRQRAPEISERIGRVDFEGIAKSAKQPFETIEDIDALIEAGEERRVRKKTAPARKRKALTDAEYAALASQRALDQFGAESEEQQAVRGARTSEARRSALASDIEAERLGATRSSRVASETEKARSEAALAPGEATLARMRQERAMNQFDAETAGMEAEQASKTATARQRESEANIEREILGATAEDVRATAAEKASGARALQPGANRLAMMGQQREEAEFQDVSQQREASRRAEIARNQQLIEEASQNIERLQGNRQTYQTTARDMAAAEAAKASRAMETAQGVPGTRIVERPEGEFEQKIVTPPSGGEPTVLEERQVRTRKQMDEADRLLQSKIETAQALAAQRNAAAQKAKTGVVVTTRTLPDQITGKSKVLITTTDKTGHVNKVETIDDSGNLQTTYDASTQVMGTRPPGAAAAAAALPQAPQQAAPTVTATNGQQVKATGAPVGKYSIGMIFTIRGHGRMVYTGGDPNSLSSYTPAIDPQQ